MPDKQRNLAEFIEKSRVLVEQKLDDLIPAKNVEPRRLHRAIRWSLLGGGKRLRPVLVFAAGDLYKADRKKLLNTAAAIEMLHTYSLIHDDLPAMDDDDLRRGRKTCHKKFDEATAILAGDALQTFAFQTIAEDKKLSPGIRMKVIAEISRAIGTPSGMIAGQMRDIEAERKKITAMQLRTIHAGKTGALITASVRSGAIIAGAGEKDLKILTAHAENLGQLFQITDDLLDVIASAEILGKTPGKDAKAEKATYVSLYGVERAQEIARKVHAEAITALRSSNNDPELLISLADYVLERKN
jgi:geranylgeranyl diphosphate synthase type II